MSKAKLKLNSTHSKPKEEQSGFPRKLKLLNPIIKTNTNEPLQEQALKVLSHRISLNSSPLDQNGITQPQSSARIATRTLDIFRNKLQNKSPVKQSFLSDNTALKKHVLYGDSANKVRMLVQKSQEVSSRHEQIKARGTMYINDLWSQDYEDNVIKTARIDKELKNQQKKVKKLIRLKQESICEISGARKDESPFRMSASVRSNTLQSLDFKNEEIMNESPTPRRLNTEEIDRSNPTKYYTNSGWFYPESIQRSSSINIDESDKKLQLFDDSFNFKNRPKMLSLISLKKFNDMPFTHELIQESLEEIDEENTELPQIMRQSPRTKKLTNIKTKTFLDETSQQVIKLMNNCKDHVKESSIYLGRMKNLDEISLSPEIEKQKKHEEKSKAELLKVCKSYIQRGKK